MRACRWCRWGGEPKNNYVFSFFVVGTLRFRRFFVTCGEITSKPLIAMRYAFAVLGLGWALSATGQRAVLRTDVSPAEQLSFMFVDGFGDYQGQVFKPDSASGKFPPAELDLTEPTFVKFMLNASQRGIVLVEPGDTVTVTKKAGHMRFVTRHPGEANFFGDLEQRPEGGVWMNDGTNYFWGRSDVNVLFADFQRRRDERLAALRRAADSLRFRAAFVREAADLIHGHYLCTVFAPAEMHWDAPFNFDALPAAVLDSLKAARAWFGTARSTPGGFYHQALVNYNRFLCRRALFQPGQFKAFFASAKTNFTGEQRDYLLFDLVKRNARQQPKGFEVYLRDFRHHCTNAAYQRQVDQLTQVQAHLSKLVSDEGLLDTELETRDGTRVRWRDVLKRNLGRVVYLDVWASWCAPCRFEMPHSRKVSGYFFGKPVAFVYISIDTEKEEARWKQAIVRDGMDDSGVQHYRLNRDTWLAVHLTNRAIPKYALFDRDGKLLTTDAARPSDPDLITQLEALLKEAR